VAEETRQFTHCAQAGVVLFIDGAPGIAIAPAGRLQALLRSFVGNDDRIHAIDIIGDAGRLRNAALALSNPAAAAPRNTTAASTTKGLMRAPEIGGPAPGTGRGQERHVR
jgi:RNA polymerase sigma-70 factor (ECF subfamily)